ncbi:MAG: hypothetical protein PT977_00945 [Acidobacteriota bacterium]|nr:hypothetical protein [Acidobacteriota bacterium]
MIAALLVALTGQLSAQVILPPDAAVKAYQAGQAAAQRKDWPLAIQKMNDALATGHTHARQHFGASRYTVDLYDPYYWLGVAHMELGEVLEAKRNLLLSRSEGVIDGFPESADLLGRLGTLERREAQLVALREAPAPTPPAPVPAVPAPAIAPASGLTARDAEPPEPQGAAGAGAESILTLFSAGDFAGAEAEVERFRRVRPEAREADLLASLVLGTRYVLEGRTDPALFARAKKALASWRRRGGGRRTEEALLSPSLLAALKGT